MSFFPFKKNWVNPTWLVVLTNWVQVYLFFMGYNYKSYLYPFLFFGYKKVNEFESNYLFIYLCNIIRSYFYIFNVDVHNSNLSSPIVTIELSKLLLSLHKIHCNCFKTDLTTTYHYFVTGLKHHLPTSKCDSIVSVLLCKL